MSRVGPPPNFRRTVISAITEVRARLRGLREAIGWTQEGMARVVRDRYPTAKITPGRISEWETRRIDIWHVGALSLLHPDPRACFQWLLHGGDFPHISVYPHNDALVGLPPYDPDAAAPPRRTGEGVGVLINVATAAVRDAINRNELQFAQSDTVIKALLAFARELEAHACSAADIYAAVAYITNLRDQHRLKLMKDGEDDLPG